MATSGLAVDEVILCPGLGSGEAADRLVQIMSDGGQYQAVRVGPDRLQFARSFRPTWALVLGWIGLLVFFLGVVFFFVKTTETAVALIEQDHRGTRIRLSGKFDRKVLAMLRGAFVDPAAAAQAAAADAAVGAPVANAYDLAPPPTAPPSGLSALPPPSGAPIGAASPLPGTAPVPHDLPLPTGAPVLLLPAAGSMPPPVGLRRADRPPPTQLTATSAPTVTPPAAPQWPVQPDQPRPAAARVHIPPPVPAAGNWQAFSGTPQASSGVESPLAPADARPSRHLPTEHGAGELRLVLDDGTELPFSELVLIGRDPACADGEQGAQLVPVVDPAMSVSKTHLAVSAGEDGFWVIDRNSTNGTNVHGPDGVSMKAEPGQRVRLAPGASVHFGARSLRLVETSTDSLGAI